METERPKIEISGFLEKKGKIKMMNSYKKYWFVLNERLLLYYRNKDEPLPSCKGSINLGPPCTIKACPSITGAFQIVTRSNTVTLRAETRDEQNRWMQALMSSTNQNPANSTRLSHFRYSMDDIPKNVLYEPKDEEDLELNEADRRISSISIIQRLQKLGAQSYSTLRKNSQSNSSLRNSLRKNSTDSIKTFTHSRNNSRENNQLFSESMKNCTSEENIATTPVYLNVKRYSSSNELPSIIIENEECTRDMTGQEKYENVRENRLENSVVVENEYSTPQLDYTVKSPTSNLRERVLSSERLYATLDLEGHQYDYTSTVVTNDIYGLVDKENHIKNKTIARLKSENFDEEIYYEPKIDHNKNVTLKEYNLDSANNENITIENDLYLPDVGLAKNNIITMENDLYLGEHMDLAENSDSAENNYEELEQYREPNRKWNVSKKLKKSKPEDEKNKTARKRSFKISALWKKRSSFSFEEDNVEETKSKEEKRKNEEEEEIYETVKDVDEKLVGTDQTTLKMLSELHSILDKKKEMLKKSFTDLTKLDDCQNPDHPESTKLSSSVPLVPPKKKRILVRSPCHDYPKVPSKSVLPPKTKPKPDQSVDDILQELGEHRYEEVTLRTKLGKRSNRNSDDELSKLLDNLSKVTCAPIMEPGATNSLMNPNISDEELLKLVPIRARRIGQPDYDIPRPHRSLVNLSYFGPVLNSPQSRITTEDSQLSSMTPDSLETEINTQSDHQMSYTSHHYIQDQKPSKGFKKSYSFDQNENLLRDYGINRQKSFEDHKIHREKSRVNKKPPNGFKKSHSFDQNENLIRDYGLQRQKSCDREKGCVERELYENLRPYQHVCRKYVGDDLYTEPNLFRKKNRKCVQKPIEPFVFKPEKVILEDHGDILDSLEDTQEDCYVVADELQKFIQEIKNKKI